MGATRVEFVAQIRAKIYGIVLRMPPTAPQFACDRRTVDR